MFAFSQTSIVFLSRRSFLECSLARNTCFLLIFGCNFFQSAISLNHYSVYRSSCYLNKFCEALMLDCKLFHFCSDRWQKYESKKLIDVCKFNKQICLTFPINSAVSFNEGSNLLTCFTKTSKDSPLWSQMKNVLSV